MDLENNQDFDLEDILKEFSDHPEAEKPAAPAGQMPELRFEEKSPVIPEELPEMLLEVSEPQSEEPEDPALSDTQTFSPPEEAAPEEPAPDEPTIAMDLPEEPQAQPAPAEPAFEVEEEFIPAPIVFTPRSRL